MYKANAYKNSSVTFFFDVHYYIYIYIYIHIRYIENVDNLTNEGKAQVKR